MPRLQFSLRALLLLMAVVGAAIVLYRWPWTESKDQGDVKFVTTYHRAWNGKPVEHGLQVVTYPDKPNHRYENWYDEGDLRRIQTIYRDGSTWDELYRDGVLHGPFAANSSEMVIRGQYHQGKKQGRWQCHEPQVFREEHWEADERHGHWTWSTPQGQLIQSADYDAGELIHWNGSTVPEAVRAWVAVNVPDARLQKLLLSPVSVLKPGSKAAIQLHRGQVTYYVGDPLQTLDTQWDLDEPPLDEPPLGQPVAEAILKNALMLGRTFSYRFGILCIVEITPQQVNWRDRTGVAEIHFEPGSAADGFWREEAVFAFYYSDHPADRLQGMFEHDKSPVPLDTTAIDNLEPPTKNPFRKDRASMTRPRRDLIGLHLDRAGCYCELVGGTLLIKPQAETARAFRESSTK